MRAEGQGDARVSRIGVPLFRPLQVLILNLAALWSQETAYLSGMRAGRSHESVDAAWLSRTHR